MPMFLALLPRSTLYRRFPFYNDSGNKGKHDLIVDSANNIVGGEKTEWW